MTLFDQGKYERIRNLINSDNHKKLPEPKRANLLILFMVIVFSIFYGVYSKFIEFIKITAAYGGAFGYKLDLHHIFPSWLLEYCLFSVILNIILQITERHKNITINISGKLFALQIKGVLK